MHVWAATLDETAPDTWADVYERGLTLVDDTTRVRLNRFYHQKDSFRGLIGSLLPRMLLKTRGIPLNRMSFSRTESGKPYIASAARASACIDPPIAYNITHDSGVVAMAWSGGEDLQGAPAYKLGTDLMKVHLPERNTFSEFLEVFNEQLTPLEHNSLLPSAAEPPLSELEALRRFYLIWTLKEAYTKALGLGMGFDFQRIEYDVMRETVRIDGVLARDWRFIQFGVRNKLRNGQEEEYVGVAALLHGEHVRQEEDCRVEYREAGPWLQIYDAVEFVEKALQELV